MKGKTKVPNFSHERVLEALDYDPSTGTFVWKIKPAKNVNAGSVAGASSKGNSYRYMTLDGEEVTTARMAWFYVNGYWPDNRIRFKNKDKSDCRYDNLTLFNGIGGDRETNAIYMRDHRRAHPELWRNTHLMRNFGISLAEYAEKAAEQDNKCAICNQPETQMRGGKVKALAVDHNHTTGAVRGLLCVDCNQAIGKMKEDRNILLAAVKYLDKHSDKSSERPLLAVVNKETL